MYVGEGGGLFGGRGWIVCRLPCAGAGWTCFDVWDVCPSFCCLLYFFLVGVCAPTCLCKAPPSPRVVCMCVPPELFSCGCRTCLLCIGGRVSLFRRLGCVCAALCSCVFPCCNGCARGRRGRACFHALGVGSVLCVGGCASPCAGLVLFVGVLVGDVRHFVVSLFFVLAGCLHLPQSHPLPTPSVSRAFGLVLLCVPPCVHFSCWGA